MLEALFQRGGARRGWRWPAVLVLLTLAAYWGVFRAGFVPYDDPEYVSENPMVQGGLSWAGLQWAFTTSAAANWHPLTWLSYQLDCQLFGVNPVAHHAVNLGLHLLNVLLVFAFLKVATSRVALSGWVAVLFAVHPLHVESVAWISERKDVLSTFFGLLSLIGWVWWTRSRRPLAWWASWVGLALGLLSKPMLVTLPVVFLLLDVWPLRRLDPNAKSRRHLVLEKAPFLALSVAASVVTLAVQGSHGMVAKPGAEDLLRQLANATVSYVWYLGKTLVPTGLTAMHPYPWSTGGVPYTGLEIGLSAALLVGISVWVFRASKEPALAVGWLWYLITLLPVIGLVRVGRQAVAERYSYLPSIGLGVVLVWGASALIDRRPRWKAPLVDLAAAATLVFVALTHLQVATWQTPEAFLHHALSVHPNNPLMQFNLAQYLRRNGRRELALEQYRRLLALEPDDETQRIYAELLFDLGQYGAAAVELKRVVEKAPGSAPAHATLGRAYMHLGQLEPARAEFLAAVRLDPKQASAQYHLAVIALREGDGPGALLHALAAARENAGVDAPPLLVLADAYALAGRPEDEQRTLAEAMAIAQRTGDAELSEHLRARLEHR